MALSTTNAAGVLLPEAVGPLVVEPLKDQSVAMRVSRVVTTGSHDFRIPQSWLTLPRGGTPRERTSRR